MRSLAPAFVLAAACNASAQEAHPEGRRADRPDRPEWEFAATAYPATPRGGETTTSAIAVADRGSLHLEARYGYELKDSRSAFAGWTFSGGEALKWEITPMIGGGWGTVHAFIPGFEASLAWKRLDFYVEAEFVRDRNSSEANYSYAWSELGFRANEWLRLGAVGQRTRAYSGDRDFQRGPFAQVAWKRVTLGAYWFNPGSGSQVLVGAIGTTF